MFSLLGEDNNDGIRKSTRGNFIGTTLAFFTTVLTTGVSPASAKSEISKGTKSDPKYTNCVSQCIFECTKPKGAEQKDRQECIPPCKKQCSTNPEQLLLGTPIKREWGGVVGAWKGGWGIKTGVDARGSLFV